MDLYLILNVPTPKAKKQTSRNNRLYIQNLFHYAGFTVD